MAESKQVNILLDPDSYARLERVRKAASEKIGTPLTNADIFRMGLAQLERVYCDPPPARPRKAT